MLSTDSKERKDTPIFSGVLMYFPDAIAEVAKVSKVGNDKHNPGQPLHWSRDKSSDHLDCVGRHLIDAGPEGDGKDGELYHLAALVWRGLAKLQLVCEARTSPASEEAQLAEVLSHYCKRPYKHCGPCDGLQRCDCPVHTGCYCTREQGHDGSCNGYPRGATGSTERCYRPR